MKSGSSVKRPCAARLTALAGKNSLGMWRVERREETLGQLGGHRGLYEFPANWGHDDEQLSGYNRHVTGVLTFCQEVK